MPNDFFDSHNKVLSGIRSVFKKDLKFSYVSPINVHKGSERGDIDLVCFDSETLFYIELKNGQTDIMDNFKSFLAKRHSDVHFLKHNYEKTKKFNWSSNKVKFFFFAPKIRRTSEEKLNDLLSKQPNSENIFILRGLAEFKKLANDVDSVYAKREFFWQHGVETPNSEELSVQAIMSSTPNNGKLYQFTCSAKELVKFASVPRRTENKKGLANYQRLVKGSRLTDIARNHIDKGGDFVNNVVLKLDKNQIMFNEYVLSDSSKKKYINTNNSNRISSGILKIKMNFNSAFIIDGQHRLLSYYKSKVDGLIRVSALVDIEPEIEAKYFIDINDNSSSVDPDLIWDLTADLSPNSNKGVISRIFKELHKKEGNIFYQSLTIPGLIGKSKKIKFSGLCRTLLDDCGFVFKKTWANYDGNEVANPFYNAEYDPETGCKLIASFFSKVFSDFDDEKNKKFFNNAVIAVYLELCLIYYKSYGKGGNKIAIENLKNIVNSITEEEIQERRVWSDSAGKKHHKETLLQEIQIKNKDFGSLIKKTTFENEIIEFEGEFREWVYNKIMDHEQNDDWLKNIYSQYIEKWENDNKYEYEEEREYYDNLGFNQVVELIVRTKMFDFWNNIFKDIFLTEGFLSLKDVEDSAKNLYRKRNPKEHASKQIKSQKDFKKGRRERAITDFKRFKKIVENYK